MSIAIAIFGLAVLILIHEAGHFFAATGGRDAAAEVLHRLPAGDREEEPWRGRVRDRRDPARRLREDPRDAPCRPGRPAREPQGRGSGGARARARPPRRSARERRRRSRPQPAARARGAPRLEPDAPGARRLARRRRLLAPEVVEAHRRDRRGPVREPRLRADPLRRRLHDRQHAAFANRRGRGERSPGGGGRAQAGRPDRHPRRPPGQGEPRFPTRSTPPTAARSGSRSSARGSGSPSVR